jgi:predicted RNA-binding protein Jag
LDLYNRAFNGESLQERDERIMNETLEKIEKALNMRKEDIELDVISKESKAILEGLLMNRAWDEIDKIADENGGRYTGPTLPDEVDTSEVSKYISERKQKVKDSAEKAFEQNDEALRRLED